MTSELSVIGVSFIVMESTFYKSVWYYWQFLSLQVVRAAALII